jgi:hypothetical protein
LTQGRACRQALASRGRVPSFWRGTGSTPRRPPRDRAAAPPRPARP